VDKTKRVPGDQPIAWPKAEAASRAVREYLMALDAARSDEESGGGEDGGSSGGGSRRKSPKEVSLIDAGIIGKDRHQSTRLRCKLSHRQQGRHHCRR
jgi:hypothetical protein